MVGEDVKTIVLTCVVASRQPSGSVLRESCLSVITKSFSLFQKILRRKDFNKFSALSLYLISILQSFTRFFLLSKSSINFTTTILNSTKRLKLSVYMSNISSQYSSTRISTILSALSPSRFPDNYHSYQSLKTISSKNQVITPSV